MKKYILALWAFCCLGWVAHLQAQQQPLFTNFFQNEFAFNPAMAGVHPEMQIRALIRRQWVNVPGAPASQVLTAAGRIAGAPFGVGAIAYNDMAARLQRTGGSVAGAYRLEVLDSAATLAVGASVGFFQWRLRAGAVVENESDDLLVSAQNGLWVPEVNIGAHFELRNGLFAGIAVPQFVRQSAAFDREDPEMGRADFVPHYHFLAGIRKFVGPDQSLCFEPVVLVKMVEGAPVQLDAGLRVIFNDKLWAGAIWRRQDAVAAMLGYRLDERFDLSYSYDYTLSDLRGSSTGSHEISIGYRFVQVKDSDQDGIPDKDDLCPEKWGPKENNGCPREAIADLGDSDGDGVPNDKDKCPDEPGPKQFEGCPWKDRDGDGIHDMQDACADLWGVASNAGCPRDDIDRDGIVGAADKCPDQPGTLATQGCPNIDSDGDGIIDGLDRCPDRPGRIDNEGCPIAAVASLPDDIMKILELAERKVFFDVDSDEIKPDAFEYLDKLAEVLIAHPDWKLRLTGHADATGPEDYNIELSKRRAEVVLFYLLNRGVPRHQIMAEYYGESQPIAPNDNPRLRYLNRRVEMHFVIDKQTFGTRNHLDERAHYRNNR